MESIDKPGIDGTSFSLVFKSRHLGYNLSAREYFLQCMYNAKRQYKLIRVNNRLRVSFIGYSYNVKHFK